MKEGSMEVDETHCEAALKDFEKLILAYDYSTYQKPLSMEEEEDPCKETALIPIQSFSL